MEEYNYNLTPTVMIFNLHDMAFPSDQHIAVMSLGH